jgi:uncharacterized protein
VNRSILWEDQPHQRVDLACDPRASFELVLKVQETCNINCTYCYMYNVGNTLHEVVPTSASIEVCEATAEFIIDEFRTRDPRFARLILHGGEPMLMPSLRMEERLSAMFRRLRAELSEEQLKRVAISLQTNATLVSEPWIALVAKWGINVGISLDGPPEVHDRQRIDFKGRGTHRQALAGISKLQAAHEQKRIPRPGALCVIDPQADGAAVYRYIVHEVGLTNLDFLYPHMNWDNYSEDTLNGVTRFLSGAFSEWKKDPTKAKVRTFERAINLLRRGRVPDGPFPVGHVVIVIESDGTISPEESLRQASDDRVTQLTIFKDRMADLLRDPQFGGVLAASMTPSTECHGCALLNSCASGFGIGRIGQRYESASYFSKRPVYCDTFEHMMVDAARALTNGGKSLDRLALFREQERHDEVCSVGAVE